MNNCNSSTGTLARGRNMFFFFIPMYFLRTVVVMGTEEFPGHLSWPLVLVLRIQPDHVCLGSVNFSFTHFAES